MNTLIVDDNPTNLKLLRAQLEAEGYSVFEAADGVEALAVLERERIGAIISDILMPRMDGYRLCFEVRASERFCSIPFVIYSNTYTSPSDVKTGLELGADLFVRKPAPARELLDALREVLKQSPSRQPRPVQAGAELNLMKEYNERLVNKLEQKNIELQSAHEQLILQATAMATAANAIIITDHTGRMLWVNEAFTRMTGYTAAEAIGQTPHILKSGKHDAAFYQKFWKTICSGRTWRGEFTNRRKDGSLYYDEHTVTPVHDAQGRLTHFIGILHDVTERKEAEAKLSVFRALVERSSDGIEVVDPETGRFLDVNETACRDSGYTREEYLALSVSDVDPAVDRATFLRNTETLRQSGFLAWESVHRRKDGSTFPVEVNIRHVELDRSYLIASVRDVTERKQLEEQVRQSQKLDTVGQLAGGVAHDFNNVLTVIQGHASLLLDKGDLAPDIASSLKEIYSAGERAANLTRQLLVFSRKQEIRTQTMNLNEVIKDVTKMLRRLLDEDIALRVDFATPLPNIQADAGMMGQVLMNLVVNARDAMPRGGRLSVRTAPVTLDAERTRRHGEARPGEVVWLSVSDTGSGISPEVLSHIFDPFFTTKEPGKGTGLGLSIVFAIVKQHQGWVEVKTEVGQGTTFEVYLPAVRATAAGGRKAPAQDRLPGGTETILLVEDEASVRFLAAIILQRCGYRVLEAASGVKALEVWKEHDREIQLLLTDMVMPDGLSGRELADQLRVQRPDLKVIYTSGYSREIIGNKSLHLEGMNYLAKPYQSRELAQAVRDCLDK
jgi:nitrogen fixation negative regulator NifL